MAKLKLWKRVHLYSWVLALITIGMVQLWAENGHSPDLDAAATIGILACGGIVLSFNKVRRYEFLEEFGVFPEDPRADNLVRDRLLDLIQALGQAQAMPLPDQETTPVTVFDYEEDRKGHAIFSREQDLKKARNMALWFNLPKNFRVIMSFSEL